MKLLLRFRAYLLCVVLMGCVVLAGCHRGPKPDTAAGFGAKTVSLRGTYGVDSGPEVEPVLKVDETRTGYAFEERTSGEWGVDPETPHTATEDEVRRALGGSAASFPVYGLVTNRAFLLKVPAGWHGSSQGGAQQVTTKSGFLLFSGGTLVAAKKVELGSR